ncbi:hypothetical protein TRIUR3_34066 [Triticum urartu]|uniref:Uncharacterized protein n=1 Tax=Triticum urartu TaxID=4572 RepID=M7ZN68_TRIUA|nr:hypothetical protein TRIUR3_34066 [Triticum urartu]
MNDGVLPVTGFPHVGGKAKRGDVHRRFELEANKGAFHTTCVHSREVVSAVIPSKQAFLERLFEFIVGSRHSRFVVVLGSSVVGLDKKHVDGSGTDILGVLVGPVLVYDVHGKHSGTRCLVEPKRRRSSVRVVLPVGYLALVVQLRGHSRVVELDENGSCRGLGASIGNLVVLAFLGPAGPGVAKLEEVQGGTGGGVRGATAELWLQMDRQQRGGDGVLKMAGSGPVQFGEARSLGGAGERHDDGGRLGSHAEEQKVRREVARCSWSTMAHGRRRALAQKLERGGREGEEAGHGDGPMGANGSTGRQAARRGRGGHGGGDEAEDTGPSSSSGHDGAEVASGKELRASGHGVRA